MDPFIKKIQQINTVEDAIEQLKQEVKVGKKLQSIIDFVIQAHKNQFRKSGEPYCVHPILVACITAHFSKDKAIIATSLLHDVVEDTEYSIDFIKNTWGSDISHMVDGLTKIVEIREDKFPSSSSKNNKKLISSALTFRKMLVASIDDVRVLIVKLCDRLHNMLTLQALPPEKQKRIAEETLLVYVPIASRLGISTLKNALEDLAFYYIYPEEYNKIDRFLKENEHAMRLTFNSFITKTKTLLEKNGYDSNKVKIYSRIKHHYSIYLKMQRKGINIDEVLDLFAIRILVEDKIDCYKVLGFMHIEFNPLTSRFKDYVATPKENGYQTIHTTVFNNSKIYEIQIRTFEMHKIAEYGIAAHWKYKTGETNTNLNWLKSLEFSNDNVEEFYKETKNDLYTEEIAVYSPKGEIFNLPVGSTALDFAYLVHTDIGKRAKACYINRTKKPLLTELKSTNVVQIILSKEEIYRCSWEHMVKTSRAQREIRQACLQRKKEINEIYGKNIINTIFSRSYPNITDKYPLELAHKVPLRLDYFKNIKHNIEQKIVQEKGIISKFMMLRSIIKEYRFDNLLIYSNFSINSVSFEHCCHPKFGDEIIAFKDENTAIIHHKMCDKAYNKILANEKTVFCQWIQDVHYQYKMVISLPNTRGELAKLLTYMAKYEISIIAIDFGRQRHSYRQYCTIEFEINKSNIEEVKKILEKRIKIIDFASKKDAYQK